MIQKTATMAKSKKLDTVSLGNLPEWNLADLYPSMDSPRLTVDLATAAADAERFEATWKGKLEQEAAKGADGKLGLAVSNSRRSKN
jgi:oligoendopeptidase F